MESVDLKDRMNYMSNAIRETLDYDEELDPDGIPILGKRLRTSLVLNVSKLIM